MKTVILDINIIFKPSKGTIPAEIEASTVSFNAARPLTPVQVNISQVLGGVNVSWALDPASQYKPKNFTLLVSYQVVKIKYDFLSQFRIKKYIIF